ncbi:hypothetical protein GCM10023259_015920 [Thermocatellispora tengchongensis]
MKAGTAKARSPLSEPGSESRAESGSEPAAPPARHEHPETWATRALRAAHPKERTAEARPPPDAAPNPAAPPTRPALWMGQDAAPQARTANRTIRNAPAAVEWPRCPGPHVVAARDAHVGPRAARRCRQAEAAA